MRHFLIACCLLAATACDDGLVTGPTVPLDEAFTVRRGQTATFDGTSLTVRFNSVSNDSRCPADALCIHGGDAIVNVRAAGDGPAADLELHTAGAGSASYGSFVVTLQQLEPFPFSNRTIEQHEYRATLRVTRH
jgi:hypothetical protein